MPVVLAHFHPIYGGGDFRDRAVLDSGSEVTWVPNSVPRQHQWVRRGLANRRVIPIGPRKLIVRQYIVTVQVAGGIWTIPVCEHTPSSKVQCTLIGQDLLYQLVASMDGPKKELRVEL